MLLSVFVEARKVSRVLIGPFDITAVSQYWCAEESEQWTGNSRFIFLLPSSLALRAKYRVCLAWLIKRLICRLNFTEVMIDDFGPHSMKMAILGCMWKFTESLWVVRSKQSWSFLVSTYANYLALIFRRLGGEVRVGVGENRQHSEGDQLRPTAEFASLVILLCISRGCRFQVTGNAKKKKKAEHDTKNIR